MVQQLLIAFYYYDYQLSKARRKFGVQVSSPLTSFAAKRGKLQARNIVTNGNEEYCNFTINCTKLSHQSSVGPYSNEKFYLQNKLRNENFLKASKKLAGDPVWSLVSQNSELQLRKCTVLQIFKNSRPDL